MVEEPKRIPIQQAAREYRVGVTTIYKYMRDKRLTRYRRGMDRRTLVDRQEMEQILTEVERPSRRKSS